MFVLMYVGGGVCPKSSGDVNVCLDLCGGFAQNALGMLMFVLIYVGGGGLPKKVWGC